MFQDEEKRLFLLAGVSILLYKLFDPVKLNIVARIGSMEEFTDLPNKINNNSKVIVELGYPSLFEIKTIAELYNIDVSGFIHTVDNYAVRHALNRHSKDTLPISKDDLPLIPFITLYPDSISKGKDKNTNSKRVVYKKKFNNSIHVIEYVLEIRTGKKNLAMVTMYKKPTK